MLIHETDELRDGDGGAARYHPAAAAAAGHGSDADPYDGRVRGTANASAVVRRQRSAGT